VYRELDLPDEIFENIQDYREVKACSEAVMRRT
jgi:hypothetical protein